MLAAVSEISLFSSSSFLRSVPGVRALVGVRVWGGVRLGLRPEAGGAAGKRAPGADAE